MFKRPIRSIAVLSLLFAAATTACDVANLPSVPEDVRMEAPASELRLVTKRFAETAGGEDVTVNQVIGVAGGRIDVGGHALVVPAGTVDSDTEFTFVLVAGPNVHVDLSAARVSDGAVVDRFPDPLTLVLSYAEVEVKDPNDLANAYLVQGSTDGPLAPLPSSVDSVNLTVSSPLYHFSGYAMAIN